MNCKPGDMAIIKTTHPLAYLHGRLVECLRHEMHWLHGDIWEFNFLGGPQLSDQKNVIQGGMIQDRHLRPIRGDAEVRETEKEEVLNA